jgi:hypothetical protein
LTQTKPKTLVLDWFWFWSDGRKNNAIGFWEILNVVNHPSTVMEDDKTITKKVKNFYLTTLSNEIS